VCWIWIADVKVSWAAQICPVNDASGADFDAEFDRNNHSVVEGPLECLRFAIDHSVYSTHLAT
jgi:hypothetical protein